MMKIKYSVQTVEFHFTSHSVNICRKDIIKGAEINIWRKRVATVAGAACYFG